MPADHPDHLRSAAAWAPGRVNLIGEHLDYNAGLCLPVTLSLGTRASVSRLETHDVVLRSGDLRWNGRLGDRTDGWAAYVLGVLAELKVPSGVEITLTSDLPIGAGLSSSAALECSVALAANEVFELGLTRAEIAAACQRAENDHVGVPTGGMDQRSVLFAAPGHGLLIDFATGDHVLVPFDPSGSGVTLLAYDTGVAHALASGEYAARRSECAQAARALGVDQVLQARFERLGELPAPLLARRARHIWSEQARVRSFVEALVRDDWEEAGHLMTASHLSLRDDYEVSCPELDVLVAEALAGGALGARLTGGGFGGAALVLTREQDVPGVDGRIRAAFAHNGWDAPTCYQVEASRSAMVLQP